MRKEPTPTCRSLLRRASTRSVPYAYGVLRARSHALVELSCEDSDTPAATDAGRIPRAVPDHRIREKSCTTTLRRVCVRCRRLRFGAHDVNLTVTKWQPETAPLLAAVFCWDAEVYCRSAASWHHDWFALSLCVTRRCLANPRASCRPECRCCMSKSC